MSEPQRTSVAHRSSPRGKRLDFGEILGLCWFTALFVLAIGIANGTSTQNNYLLPGLRMADPTFLRGDWFTWDTVPAHTAFVLLIAGMAKAGMLIFGLTVGTILQSAMFAIAYYSILRTLYDRPLIPWASSLALFAGFSTVALGYVWWLQAIVEPSVISSVVTVGGLACLARRRLLCTGLMLGVAGLMHAQFVILAGPILVGATIAGLIDRGEKSTWKQSGFLWGSFLLVSSPSLISIFTFLSAPGVEEIRWLTVSVFPFHVAPWTWGSDYYVRFFAVILLGIAGIVLRSPRSNRHVTIPLLTVAVTVLVSVFLARFQLSEFAVQTWLWRLSPLILLAGLGAGFAALSDQGSTPWRHTEYVRLGWGLLLCSAVVIAKKTEPPLSYTLLAACGLPIASWVAKAGGRRWRVLTHRESLLMGLVVTVAFLPIIGRGLRHSHLEFRPEDPGRAPLYEWIRSDTAAEAVFAVPPSWQRFRLQARRPIVADFKSIPRYAPNRIEWLERIRALTGIERPGPKAASADSAYASMDCERARSLQRRYGVRYVLHERPKALPCGRLVFEDELFRVWELDQGD